MLDEHYYFCSKCRFIYDEAGLHKFKNHKKYRLDHIPDSLIDAQKLGGSATETVDDLMCIIKILLSHIHDQDDENPDGEASTEDEDGDAYPPDEKEDPVPLQLGLALEDDDLDSGPDSP
jgi:hypothetical protein